MRMAGSFGYEAEHYDVAQNVGELVLFSAVRQAPAADVIAAPGTSCRHQIHDRASALPLPTATDRVEPLAEFSRRAPDDV